MTGTAIVMEISGPAKQRIQALREKYDSLLANNIPVEITIAGSSGLGTIASGQNGLEIIAELQRLARSMRPFEAKLGKVVHFPNSTVYAFEALPRKFFYRFHRLLAGSNIQFEKSDFPFFPHCSLHIWGKVPEGLESEMIRVKVEERFAIDSFALYQLVGENSAVLVRRFFFQGRQVKSS